MNDTTDGVVETTAVVGNWMDDTTEVAAGEGWDTAPTATGDW